MDIRRGIIRKFDSDTYLADVQIVGSMATMLPGVPVAKQIGGDLLTSGSKCGVLFFDETNPSDACVVFVYEGVPDPHPGARVYRSVDQSIPNATWTKISFDNERFDTDGIWSSANPTRLVCKTAGKYQVTAHGCFYANTTGDRYVHVTLNGTTDIVGVNGPGSIFGPNRPWHWDLTTLYDLAVNDYLEVRVWQNSGGPLSIRHISGMSPEFMMVKVA